MSGFKLTVTRSGKFKLDDSPLREAVNEGARAVRNNARRLIRARDKSGAERSRPRGEGRQKYRASAPGEAPARYTGHLASHMRMWPAKAGRPRIVAYAVADSPHAHLLEYGTQKMAARPFLGPAVKQARANHFRNVKAAANRMIRVSASKTKGHKK